MDLHSFPFVYRSALKWGEMDSLGHVNNAVYFRYLEEARIDAFRTLDLLVRPDDTAGPVLAYIDCQFKHQTTYPDQMIVGSWISQIGRTSMTIMHRVFSQKDQVIVAESKSVVVLINYESSEKIPISAKLRETIRRIQAQVDLDSLSGQS